MKYHNLRHLYSFLSVSFDFFVIDISGMLRYLYCVCCVNNYIVFLVMDVHRTVPFLCMLSSFFFHCWERERDGLRTSIIKGTSTI